MGVKKYRLVPEREYEQWLAFKESQDNKSIAKPLSNIINSDLPDSIKNKLIQDQTRIENNEAKRVQDMAKHGMAKPVMKDSEVQHDSPSEVEIGTSTMDLPIEPPPPPPSPPPANKSKHGEDGPGPSRRTPSTRTSRTEPYPTENFQRDNMKKIAKYLAGIGVGGTPAGLVTIKSKPIPNSNYVDCIRQLTDARLKRSDATLMIIAEVKKHTIPTDMFKPGIMNVIQGAMKPHIDAVSSSSPNVKWDEY